MLIRFSRLTNDRHRLEIIRDDGSRDAVDLETRTLLLHDLVHYAVEVEAGFLRGFWGLLAAGATLAALGARDMLAGSDDDLASAERIVGPMQSVWNERADAALTGLDADLVARVRERLRGLVGRWRATRFGNAMELDWPPVLAGRAGSP